MANSPLISAILENPVLMYAFFESLPEPTFLINREGVYVETWGGTDRSRHHDPATIIGLNQYQVLPHDKARWFNQIVADVIDSGQHKEFEYELDPKTLPCFEGIEGPQDVQYFNALVIPLAGTEYVLWTVRNITEYKRTVEKLATHQLELEKLTYIDHLTQVYNRYAMDSLLPQALDMARLEKSSAAIFMIDIDCFKQYNDHYGHVNGDNVLRQVGKLLQHWKRKHDLCFRYGGDEFLLFLTDIDDKQCKDRAYQLLDKVRELAIPHKGSHVSPYVSITIGIQHCVNIPTDMTPQQFVAIADKALFHAKHQQRGTIHMLKKD